MSYKLITIESFDKELKRLIKKHHSLKSDFLAFVSILKTNPNQGTSLGNNCYKVRLAIKSKGKGKSGGARIITHLVIEKETVYLLSIYDKSEIDTVSDKEIKQMLSQIEE